jgi:hypothetical protein
MNNSYQQKVWENARRYLEAGFSLIPCTRDKKPGIAWQEYTIRSAYKHEVDRWFKPFEEEHQSIGLVCGAISNNLVVIDLDGIPAIRKFASQFKNLCEQTRSVLTGSQEGVHLYFRVKDLTANANVRVQDVGGFELRGNGQYVIAPPSRHPSGHEYRIYRNNPIMELDNLNEVRDWMESLRENEQAKRQAEISGVSGEVAIKVPANRKKNFLKKVLSEEIARVATSSEGQRNNSLFYAGLRLANYASGNKELSWDDCKSALILASNLPFSEAYRTVESAWKIGSKYPKEVN